MRHDSVAAGFERDSYTNLLEPLRKEFDLDIWQFVSFVRATAAHIDKDGVMDIVRDCKERVGTNCMVRLFSISGLASRILEREWEARLKQFCKEMGNEKAATYLNKHKAEMASL
jgi:hypothetical protein